MAAATEPCPDLDPVCQVGDAVGGVVGDIAGSQFGKMADEIYGGYIDMQNQFLTSWISADPLMSLEEGSIQWLQGILSQFSFILAIAGVLIAGGYTVFAQRGEHVQRVSSRLVLALLVGSIGTGVFSALNLAMDELAAWFLTLNDPTGEQAVVQYTTETVVGFVAPGILLIGGVIGVLGVILQWGIMIVRAAIIPLLLGFWPIAAAAATMKAGEETFSKITAWLVAFLLYKPVAAIIYVFAFRLREGGDGIGGMITGLVLLCIAVLALPAIMRLIVPASSALGRAAGGAMAAGAVAAVGATAVAAGAAVATGGGSAAATSGAAASTGAASTGGAAAAGNTGQAAAANSGGSTAASSGPTGASTSSAGKDGGSGSSGPSGASGSSTSGSDGSNGSNGMDGATGASGQDGAAGTGSDGVSGKNGALGQAMASRMPSGSTKDLDEMIGE